MSILTNPARFRRSAAGLALIVASVMFVVADAIAPTATTTDDTAAYVDAVAQSPGAQATASLLQVLGFAILVVGIVGIVHLIRGRGVALAHLGGALAVIGLGTFPALAATGIIDSIAVETIGREAHVTLIEDGFESSGAAIVVLAVSLLGGILGALLLGGAVWRSGLAPWWAGAAIVVGAILLLVAQGQLLFLVGDLLHLVGFGYLGVLMLRMGDGQWERPPADWRGDGAHVAEPVGRVRATEPARGGWN